MLAEVADVQQLRFVSLSVLEECARIEACTDVVVHGRGRAFLMIATDPHSLLESDACRH